MKRFPERRSGVWRSVALRGCVLLGGLVWIFAGCSNGQSAAAPAAGGQTGNAPSPSRQEGVGKEPNMPPPAGPARTVGAKGSGNAKRPSAAATSDENMIDVNTAGGTRGGGYALFVHAVAGGQPVGVAAVVAYDDQNQEIDAAKTDKDGYARLLLPAAGQYRLVVKQGARRRELSTEFKPGAADVEVDLAAKN